MFTLTIIPIIQVNRLVSFKPFLNDQSDDFDQLQITFFVIISHSLSRVYIWYLHIICLKPVLIK